MPALKKFSGLFHSAVQTSVANPDPDPDPVGSGLFGSTVSGAGKIPDLYLDPLSTKSSSSLELKFVSVSKTIAAVFSYVTFSIELELYFITSS